MSLGLVILGWIWLGWVELSWVWLTWIGRDDLSLVGFRRVELVGFGTVDFGSVVLD